MEFNPNNPVIKRCIEGMMQEAAGKQAEAASIFMQAWKEATNDFEKFIAAYFVAKHQKNVRDQLYWFETALAFASKINDVAVNGAIGTLHTHIAKCYEDLNEKDKARQHVELAKTYTGKPFDKGPFYHGTKASLQAGDLLTAGFNSNYQADLTMNHIYFTALANGAGLAAALAKGEGPERVYIVEPTGSFEDDPNVTDKKFPGNLTRSYRTEAPLKIIGEVTDWMKQSADDIKKWREKLAKSNGEIIN